MGVDVGGDSDAGVAEEAADEPSAGRPGEEQRGGGASQVVGVSVAAAGGLGVLAEVVGDVALQRPPDRRAFTLFAEGPPRGTGDASTEASARETRRM